MLYDFQWLHKGFYYNVVEITRFHAIKNLRKIISSQLLYFLQRQWHAKENCQNIL